MTIPIPQSSAKMVKVIFICVVSALGGFVFGYDAVIISGTLGLFKAQFELSALQEGMFVNSALIGTALGTLFSGKVSDSYGRKSVLFFGAVLIILSVIGCVIGSSYSNIWLFRFIGGFGTGMATMISPLYIAEITPTAIRGRMVSFFQLSMTIGGATATFANVYIFEFSTNLLHFNADLLFLSGDFLNKIFIVQRLPATRGGVVRGFP